MLFTITQNIDATFESIDSSELSLLNFRYFQYPRINPTPYMKAPEPTSILRDGFNRAGAIVTYFRNTIFGSPWLETRHTIPFDPEAGKRNAYEYQQRHGYRGEKLIALIGKGYSPESLRNSNVDPRLNYRNNYRYKV